MTRVQVISNYFLAAVFLFTGVDKLLHYNGFTNALGSYALVPEGAAQYLALPIILSEVWIGLGLVVKAWRSVAAPLAAILLLIFTSALIVNFIHAPEAVCGCWFSITLGTANITHILMNLTLVGLAVFVWFDARAREKITASTDHHSTNSRSDANSSATGTDFSNPQFSTKRLTADREGGTL